MSNVIKNAVKNFELCGFTYGSIIRKDWFYEQFGLKQAVTIEDDERNRNLYAVYMGHLRQCLLIEKKMALKSKEGYGQEVVSPNNQTQWAVNDFTSGLRKAYCKTMDRLTNIDLENLSTTERVENTDAIAKLSFFAKISKKNLIW